MSVAMVGGIAINTAHELGHKRPQLEKWLSKVALAESATARWQALPFAAERRSQRLGDVRRPLGVLIAIFGWSVAPWLAIQGEVGFSLAAMSPAKVAPCGILGSMSSDDVEVVRRGYEAFNRRDTEAAEAVLDPGVVWDATDGDSPGMNQIYHGPAGVRRFWQTWLADLTDVRVEIDELVDCGERVFAAVHAVGRGRSSGALGTTQWFLVYTVRGGLIVRMTGFRDRQAALEAGRRAE